MDSHVGQVGTNRGGFYTLTEEDVPLRICYQLTARVRKCEPCRLAARCNKT